MMLSFWSMCLFRHSPALLPKSHLFLGITVTIHLILTTALSRNMYSFMSQVLPAETRTEIDLQRDIVNAIFGLIIYSGLVYGVMRIFNFQERTYQTLFALFGTSVIFTAFMLIGAAIGATAPLVWVLALASVGIWSLLVSGYILGQAMEMSLFKGVLAIVAISVVQAIILMAFFGEAEVPAPVTQQT